jgi:hypothetical protein
MAWPFLSKLVTVGFRVMRREGASSTFLGPEPTIKKNITTKTTAVPTTKQQSEQVEIRIIRFQNACIKEGYQTRDTMLVLNITNNRTLWDELIAYFPLIRHGPNTKRCVQQFFYCCVCICCRSNVFTEPLRNKDRGIHIQTHRLMGGIYEVRY